MFFKRMTSTGAASTASADSDTAVPSSSAAGHARSGEIRARHGAGFVAPFNNNDGEDGDGGRRAGGGGTGGRQRGAGGEGRARRLMKSIMSIFIVLFGLCCPPHLYCNDEKKARGAADNKGERG